MTAAVYAPPCACVGAANFHEPSCRYFDSAHDPAGLADDPFGEGSPDDPDRSWRWRDGDDVPDDLDVNAGEDFRPVADGPIDEERSDE